MRRNIAQVMADAGKPQIIPPQPAGNRYVLSLSEDQMKALAIMSYYVSGGEREHPTTLDTAAAFAEFLARGHESEERIVMVREFAQDIWDSAVAQNLEV